MFAHKPWKEIIIHMLLTAVILFNALIPTAVRAKSSDAHANFVNYSENSNGEKKTETNSSSSTENNYSQQRLPHPVSKVAENARRPEKTVAQTSDAMLVCYSDNCTDSGPGVVLTEIVDDPQNTGWHYFQVQCVGGSCPKKDIYWRASMVYTIGNVLNNPHTVEFDTSMYAEVQSPSQSGEGTGNLYLVFCGYATYGESNTCQRETSGVIPKELFNDNPNSRSFVIAVAAHSVSYTWAYRQGTIRVSLDPNLLDGAIPADSVNCKNCPYGQTQGSAADPINTNTGVMSYSENDLEIPTSMGPLSFKHTYVSSYVNRFTAPLGYGWVHNQDLRLIFPAANEPGFVKFKDRSGNLYQFWDTGQGRYFPYAGYTASLTKNSGTPTTYTLRDQAQNVYTFDQDGKVTSLVNPTGQGITYIYDTSGRLERVSADGGARYFNFSYNTQGQLTAVTDTDHTNRSIAFGYDATSGDLISYTDVLDQTWHYEYQDHLLTYVRDGNLNLVERNEYYSDGRAWKQFDGDDKLIAELTYHTDGTTTVTDALGNDITHTYDSRKTLTGDANYFGQTQKAYDGNFRPISIQDALGNPPTTLDWSADGANLEYIKDALNNETFIAYDPSNNPTSIIDPLDHETKYFYTDSNFPTLPTRIEYPLSYDNGLTYIGTDYEYYPPSSGASTGKVKFVTDALDHQTYYTYTSIGQTESVTTAYGTSNAQTTTYAYDNLGRVIDLTDEQGLVTHSDYDDAGHLLKATRNYIPSRPQNDENKYNLVTEYRYDLRGDQIAVVDTYGVITRTYYDLAERPVTVVQNLTGQTVEAVSPPARGSGISDENIRMDTIYDDAGNVIATIDPDGIITRTYYDEANRPVTTVQNLVGQDISVTTPPNYNPASPDQNVRTDTVYDANGNVIASIDTEGVITRTYYDELNRPVTVVQNLTGQAISVATPPGRGTGSNVRTDTYYDANGNVIATMDPRGVITRTYYDAMNRPVTVVQNLSGQAIGDATPPTAGTEVNIRSDTYYDQAGNVIATVDPRGVVTRTYYDESNRPVITVQNLVGQNIYVTAPPARSAADQNVRMDIAYDQDGRRDTNTDPLGRVTKYEYDEVGQLLKTIANYSNGGTPQNDQDQRNIVTEYAYDVLGRQIKTTDTLGRVTLNAYDDLGRVTSVTQNYLQGHAQNYKDASGDEYNLITTYAYDVRGD